MAEEKLSKEEPMQKWFEIYFYTFYYVLFAIDMQMTEFLRNKETSKILSSQSTRIKLSAMKSY